METSLPSASGSVKSGATSPADNLLFSVTGIEVSREIARQVGARAFCSSTVERSVGALRPHSRPAHRAAEHRQVGGHVPRDTESIAREIETARTQLRSEERRGGKEG